jgi:hypothetical protein
MPKDHFVPEFYLKRWSSCNKDGRLHSCRFIKHTGKLSWDSHAPAGTAYELDLYQEIEEKFFKPLDNDSCKLLTSFEELGKANPGKHDLGEEGHNIWAKFLLAQIIRVPHNVNHIMTEYIKNNINAELARKQIPKIIGSETAIRDLRSMQWVFATVNVNLEIITCDNPVIFKPKNLAHENCVVILPMSPRHFFLASNERNFARLEINQRKMVTSINLEIIKNAKDRIYARSCDSIKESFILKHWNYN